MQFSVQFLVYLRDEFGAICCAVFWVLFAVLWVDAVQVIVVFLVNYVAAAAQLFCPFVFSFLCSFYVLSCAVFCVVLKC